MLLGWSFTIRGMTCWGNMWEQVLHSDGRARACTAAPTRSEADLELRKGPETSSQERRRSAEQKLQLDRAAEQARWRRVVGMELVCKLLKWESLENASHVRNDKITGGILTTLPGVAWRQRQRPLCPTARATSGSEVDGMHRHGHGSRHA